MPRTRSNLSPAKALKVAEASRLSSSLNQKQDASATLPPAPTGRNIPAQGNALGHRPTTNPSPEGATQGWRIAKISDFAKTTSGGTPSRANPEFYTGNIPWIKSGDLNDGNVSEATEFITKEALKSSSAKLFPAGTLMIALYGATIGKLGILTIDAATNQAVCGIFVSEGVETKYLFYFLLQHRQELIKQGAGGAQPNISQGIIRDIEVPLPPLPEQRRIVARIEELFSRLDAGVAALRHAKAQLQRYRQSVLAAAVTGQLTQAWREQKVAEASRLSSPDKNQRQDASATLPYESAKELLKRILKQRREQWNGRGKYTEAVSAEPLNLDFPATWTITNIDSVISGIEAGKNFKCEERPPTEGETGLVKISAVTWGKFDELESKTVTRDDQIRKEHVIHSGDFLLSRANTLELVGAPVIVEQITRHLMLSDKVLRLRFVERIEKFALFWLRSKLGRKEIESRATGSQLSMRNIAQGSLRAIPIPLPPLAEQNQILAEVAARTTAIDHLEAELDRQITRSNRLRQSTLASAFRGDF